MTSKIIACGPALKLVYEECADLYFIQLVKAEK